MFTVQYPPNGIHRGEAYLMENGDLRFTIVHREGSLEGGLPEWVAACMDRCLGIGTDELRSHVPPAAPTRGEDEATIQRDMHLRYRDMWIGAEEELKAKDAEIASLQASNQRAWDGIANRDKIINDQSQEVARLRGALRTIVDVPPCADHYSNAALEGYARDMRNIARAALQGTNDHR